MFTRAFCIYIFLNAQTNLSTYLFVNSREAPAIHIPGKGVMVGTYLKMYRSQSIKAYLGIQYASANRFSPPVMNTEKWNGVMNATSFGSECWQNKRKNINKNIEIVQNMLKLSEIEKKEFQPNYDENCLNLNIFIPDGPQSHNGYAVVVWIHSGDFSYGCSSDLNPFQFVLKQQVIVVTLSYRLNIFGFLSTIDGEAQGNYGLMDQSAALFWIRQNINLFGGDDGKITIMGHSSGSISAGLHLTSGDWSRGTFQKAILMSGNPLFEKAVRSPFEYNEVLDSVANIFGCFKSPFKKLIECLRRIDAKILAENLPPIEWGPVVDKGLSNNTLPFIKDFPIKLFENGQFEKIPLLTGFSDMEDVLEIMNLYIDEMITEEVFNAFISEIAIDDLKKIEANETLCKNLEIVLESIKFTYNPNFEGTDGYSFNKQYIKLQTDRKYVSPTSLFANIISRTNLIFVYSFIVRPWTEALRLPYWISVPQYFDQLYVWGLPYLNHADKMNDWNSVDKRISDIVMTLWANFAKTSNPTSANVFVKWNKYEANTQKVLNIDRIFNSTSLLYNQNIPFWNTYYPKMLQFALLCCNSTLNVGSQIYVYNTFALPIILLFILNTIVINLFIIF